jgi:hypothetical protein
MQTLSVITANTKSYRLLSTTYIILPRKGYCMYLYTRDGYNAEYYNFSRSRLSLIAFGTITILFALFLNSIQTGYSQPTPDFSISINPSSSVITAGDTAESTITVNTNIIELISLSCFTTPTSSSGPVTCNIDPLTITSETQSDELVPAGTAKLTISTKPETQPNKYTVYVTGDAGGEIANIFAEGIQRTAAFEIDVKDRAGGGLSPTMLAIIIGGAAVAVGGGVFVVLKKRSASKADQSIP